MRLIDADALKFGLVGLRKSDNPLVDSVLFAVLLLLEDTPTIDPEDLRPKGHWIEMEVHGSLSMVCSVCEQDSGLCYEQNYCPNCGTKMENNNETD